MNEKTHAEIIDWMRKSSTGPQELADMLDAAHKREGAAEAYKSYCEIRAKYRELNVERKKKLHVEMLEKGLAKVREEN